MRRVNWLLSRNVFLVLTSRATLGANSQVIYHHHLPFSSSGRIL